ncbi:Phage major capsid protein, P2 family [compost metagenome]
MDNQTRKQYKALLAQVAQLNGVESATEQFTVTPAIQQRLEKAIQQSSAFLQQINIIGVKSESGESIGLTVTGPIARRTNTAGGNRRNPKDLTSFKSDSYTCKMTEFDSGLPYSKLDAWADFDNFQELVSKSIVEQQALDRIMVGFNGTSAAVATDPVANPLLQDVNIGWLEKVRTNAPEQVMTEVVAASGEITIGAGGDYSSLHTLVQDLKSTLDPWHKKRSDLVVLLSSDMLDEKILKTMEKGDASNQEELAADEILMKGRIGGLPPVDAPFFPDGTVVVTTLKNMSIYFQKGARRRYLKDEPEYSRVADYQSSNEAYVIEDLGLIAMAENVTPYVAP